MRAVAFKVGQITLTSSSSDPMTLMDEFYWAPVIEQQFNYKGDSTDNYYIPKLDFRTES